MANKVDRVLSERLHQRRPTVSLVSASTTSATLVAAPGAGKRLVIHAITIAYTTPAAITTLAFRSATDNKVNTLLPASTTDTKHLSFPGGVEWPANTTLTTLITNSPTTLNVSVQYSVEDVV